MRRARIKLTTPPFSKKNNNKDPDSQTEAHFAEKESSLRASLVADNVTRDRESIAQQVLLQSC
jgi:hypothetical protein